MANHALSWMGPLGVGAALMYLFDPTTGRRRRALLRDQCVHLSHKTNEASGKLARDLQNRVAGIGAALRRHDDYGPADDAVIEARVRSALGRVSTHPGAIGVACVDGIVELVGPVLAAEYDAVWRAVTNVPGTIDVIDNLVVHERADSVPGLQGEGSVPTNGEWSPTVRMLAVLGGVGLIAYGVRERNAIGGIAAAAGAGLIARGFNDHALQSVLESLRLPNDEGIYYGDSRDERLNSGQVHPGALGESAAVL